MHRISIDVMGGDNSPDSVIQGLEVFLSKNKDKDFRDLCCFNQCDNHSSCSNSLRNSLCWSELVGFDLFGNEDDISRLLEKYRIDLNKYNISIHNTGDNVIKQDVKVASAIRNAKGTSMYEAVNHVKIGGSDAVVSCGNTGVYMALSKILLKAMDGIDRPALLTKIPKQGGHVLMLDVGANSECNATNFIQFAIIGSASYSSIYGEKRPRVAILNIGSEVGKGTKQLNDAYSFLSCYSCINFCGFIEACDLFNGDVDVVVTDGFSGNVAIKSMEGATKFMYLTIKRNLLSGLMSRIGSLFSLSAFKKVSKIMDPRLYNGAFLAGLSGISVKSHGNSDAVAFANAIETTYKLVKTGFVSRLSDEISSLSKVDQYSDFVDA